jgi:hypothetical protein
LSPYFENLRQERHTIFSGKMLCKERVELDEERHGTIAVERPWCIVAKVRGVLEKKAQLCQ